MINFIGLYTYYTVTVIIHIHYILIRILATCITPIYYIRVEIINSNVSTSVQRILSLGLTILLLFFFFSRQCNIMLSVDRYKSRADRTEQCTDNKRINAEQVQIYIDNNIILSSVYSILIELNEEKYKTIPLAKPMI